jgi:hypothetical protein
MQATVNSFGRFRNWRQGLVNVTNRVTENGAERAGGLAASRSARAPAPPAWNLGGSPGTGTARRTRRPHAPATSGGEMPIPARAARW